MPKNTDWSKFYEVTKSAPPSPLLVKALEYVPEKGKAIDIGGGALKDTRFLLEKGFEVTVVDKESSMAKIAQGLLSEKLHCVVSSFVDFDFPKDEYVIASAMFALPFNSPETFDEVFQRIKRSLAPGGIFCGQFFGTRDEWATNKKMTFHTKEQVEGLLEGMDIIELSEKEWDGKLATGEPKHWHVFNVIARKIDDSTRHRYEICKAKAEDIPSLSIFQKELHGDWFESSHSDLEQAVSAGHVWVATEGDKAIGYQLCEMFGPTQENFPNSVFLSELFVAFAYRKQGIGGQLIEAALKEDRPQEYGYFSLTHDQNEPHLTKYYEKFGFKEDGKIAVGNVRMVRQR